MAGRKLLYMLRRPLLADDDLLPDGTSSSSGDDISVVLLDAAVAGSRQFPGRTFVLREDPDRDVTCSNAEVISYTDLVRLVIEADSTIVI
jgi:hypothetical protein